MRAGDLSPPLRAGLVASARAVAAARSIIMCGDTHEEEDFSSVLSGLDLHDTVTDVELIGLLNQAEEQCASALNAAKKQQEAADGVEVGLAEAVLCRLRFRRGFCGALLNLARPSSKTVDIAKKMLRFAEEQLNDMARSVELGTPRSELSHLMEGLAVRKRLGAAPAKKPPWISRSEGIDASRKLINELKAVCTVGDESDDYDGFAKWVHDLVKLPRPGPHILTRSACQLIGVTEDPRQTPDLRPTMAVMVAGAVSAYAGIDNALTRELINLPPVVDFLQQLATGELARFRLYNINRGRQRRRLRHYLSDWAPLQELAETLDAQLQHAQYVGSGQGPYGAFCLHRTLNDMLHYILLGFELELCACEYAFAYWYADLVCSMQLQLHKEVENKAHQSAKKMHDLELQQAEARAEAAARDGGKKGRKAAKDAKG